MSNDKVSTLNTPEGINDPLQAVLQDGAQRLLKQAIEAEVNALLETHSESKTKDNKRAVVRSGYLPKRTVQTGLGDVSVQVPKVRDRNGTGIKFTSNIVPPYLKRSKTIEAFLPWLYLRGVSTGDFSEALKHLLGEQAPGLSANTIKRLKQQWLEEHTQWQQRDLSHKRYVYVWADGIYSNVRQDDRLCLLVLIGADEKGNKELLGLTDGYRESESSWQELLAHLHGNQNLKQAPELAIGDGALGFWKAVTRQWPATRQQRCWVHKTANVLEKMPKSVQPKMKAALKEIQHAETQDTARAC